MVTCGQLITLMLDSGVILLVIILYRQVVETQVFIFDDIFGLDIIESLS